MTTPRELLAAGVDHLDRAGVASPRTDAERLLAHSLGVPRSVLITVRTVDPEVERRYARLVHRRAAREPLQHLVGSAAFRHVELAVGPGVFIPRPESELLVDVALDAVREVPTPVVVDLCAGSGALALAVADELRGAVVYAVERSTAALPWLRRNTVGSPVQVVAGDVGDPRLLADLDGQVHAVLSNPPYVPAATMVGAEVAHDPADAVFAGPDGLSVIPAVVAAAGRLLRPGGILVMEHDESQHASVPSLLGADLSWIDIADHVDLAGRPRYVTCVRGLAASLS